MRENRNTSAILLERMEQRSKSFFSTPLNEDEIPGETPLINDIMAYVYDVESKGGQEECEFFSDKERLASLVEEHDNRVIHIYQTPFLMVTDEYMTLNMETGEFNWSEAAHRMIDIGILMNHSGFVLMKNLSVIGNYKFVETNTDGGHRVIYEIAH